MSEECTHDCSHCSANCTSRTGGKPESLIAPQNAKSHVRHVIGVVSGKGGVGKSLVTSLLAVAMRRHGFRSGILDADVTGPSIPRLFGVGTQTVESAGDSLMLPPESRTGIPLMSVNLLLDDETKPVVWRGSMISGAVKQFWTDTAWGDVDFLFVDMPPGTGDVPLTVFQSIPLDGIVIVTSPQELVSMIVTKAVNMAEMMNIPVLGVVENYSYLICPDCGKKIEVFGHSDTESALAAHQLPLLARIPIDPSLPPLCDSGRIEEAVVDCLDDAAAVLADRLA